MTITFGDIISDCYVSNDKESQLFLEYILLKYFNDGTFFTPILDALPLLEALDKDAFVSIISNLSE